MRSSATRAQVFKRQIDERLAQMFGMPRTDVALITGQFMREVQYELLRGSTVYLTDLGLLVPHHKHDRLRLLLEPCRRMKERAMNMMDKYGVRTSQPKPEKDTKCPQCGGTAEQHGKVLICPTCGSAPFERARRAREEEDK